MVSNQGGYISTTGWTDNECVVTYPIVFSSFKVALAFGSTYGISNVGMITDVPKIGFTAKRSGNVGACWLAFGV